MGEFMLALANATNFGGRSRRREYWMFVLFQALVMFAVSAVCAFAASATHINALAGLPGLLALLLILPGFAVAIRRLHDVGKSGWYLLVNLVPLIGSLWFLLLMVRDSEPGVNQYGPNPKGY
ncbi:MAG: DUF805 domain-containing protein [Proteobacteria bacterium]|nr:DUF805 domain-containing protein [Pseudomonadota bacterium]